MTRAITYFGFLLLFTSCLDEVQVDVGRVDAQLVVEGSIHSILDRYEVRLSSVSSFDGITTGLGLGTNAIVQISEIDGPTIQLTEITDGVYWALPGQIIGEVGKSYQLRIELTNGEIYQSSVETIPEPIGIVSGEAEFFERTVTDINDISTTTIGHDIILEVENTQEDHFFIVENKSWAQVGITYGDCGLARDAPPPAGPTSCWTFRDQVSPNELIISDNLGLSKQNYLFNPVSIPFDFKGEYIAQTRLLAMSPSNYIFWNSIQDQLQRPGGLFDRPFAPIVGNIIQVNGSKTALGYFHAYGSSEQITCFDRSTVEAGTTVPGPFPCPILCTDVWAPATFTDVSNFFCD